MADPLLPPDVLPLGDPGTANSLSAWTQRRAAARDVITQLKVDWDKNLDRLLVKRSITGMKDEIVVPKDYATVQQKLALLMFQVPQIQLEPAEPNPLGEGPGLDPLTMFQAVINHYLTAPDGVHAAAMVEEVLMDALCPSGIFAAKISYENTIDGTKQVQTGMQPDPTALPPSQPGAVLGLGPQPVPPMVPTYATVPNIVSERYLFDRISPAKLLIPEEFTRSDYDRAPWLGFDFVLDYTEALKEQYQLPDDFNAFVGEDTQLLGKDRTTPSRGLPKRIKGSEIWYRASLFDPTVTNPEQLRVLVLIDGLDRPAEHRDSPYQRQNPDGSLDGMIGFPIHVGALRYIPDTAFPPSDTQMSRFQVEELSKGRTQMMRQRARNIPIRVGDSALGEEFFSKIEKGDWQGVIPIATEHFANPSGPLREVAQAQFPRESFTFDDYARRDHAECWAMDVNQSGVSGAKDQTATEVATIQANSNVRLRKERNKFLDWFARGTAKLGSLIQLFADETQYVAILGPDGSKRLEPWDKTKIQGKYLFSVKPNSAAFVDEQEALNTALKQYNLLINSPFINGQELTTALLRKMDLDPAALVQQPQPHHEQPKLAWSFTGQDLNPAAPQYPIVVEILRQMGVQVPDLATQQAESLASEPQGMLLAPPPGGLTPTTPVAHALPNGPRPPIAGGAPHAGPGGPHRVEPLNQHAFEQTGQRPGVKPIAPGAVA